MLKERTSYMKIVDGDVVDFHKDGRWVDVYETGEGGARISLSLEDLECLDKINRTFEKSGKMVVAEICEKEDGLIILDEQGKQIPFCEIMKVLFG